MESDKPSIDSIFLAAVERPAKERSVYLNEVCGNDVELRARVERLLSAQSKVASFLESPAPELGPTLDQPITEKPGTQIGHYKLLQQIGVGGFGASLTGVTSIARVWVLLGSSPSFTVNDTVRVRPLGFSEVFA